MIEIKYHFYLLQHNGVLNSVKKEQGRKIVGKHIDESGTSGFNLIAGFGK